MAKQGKWVKVRKEIKKYPQTEQQRKIALAGELISKKCSGLTGGEFVACRSRIMEDIFGKKTIHSP